MMMMAIIVLSYVHFLIVAQIKGFILDIQNLVAYFFCVRMYAYGKIECEKGSVGLMLVKSIQSAGNEGGKSNATLNLANYNRCRTPKLMSVWLPFIFSTCKPSELLWVMDML